MSKRLGENEMQGRWNQSAKHYRGDSSTPSAFRRQPLRTLSWQSLRLGAEHWSRCPGDTVGLVLQSGTCRLWLLKGTWGCVFKPPSCGLNYTFPGTVEGSMRVAGPTRSRAWGTQTAELLETLHCPRTSAHMWNLPCYQQLRRRSFDGE